MSECPPSSFLPPSTLLCYAPPCILADRCEHFFQSESERRPKERAARSVCIEPPVSPPNSRGNPQAACQCQCHCARARARNANSRERRREYKLHGWMPASSHENKKIENNVTKLLKGRHPAAPPPSDSPSEPNLLGSLTTVGRVRCSRLCVSCQQTTTAAALWTLRSNRLCGRSGSCDSPRPRIRGVECLGPAQYQ